MGKDNELLYLIKSEDIQSLTRLLCKVRNSKPKLLGSKRVNVNVQDSDGMSGLHQAALMGNVEIMKLLLESEAAVNIKDMRGMRPIHYAAWQGRFAPVEVLLQWNSSVNEPAGEGETPLHLACQHGHYEVTKLLLYYHASILICNKAHKTPLDLACEFGRLKVVELLLNSNRCSPLLEDSPQDTLDNTRTTCLHLAAKNGHADIVRLLLKAGININRSTLQGTCLHEAALCGKREVAQLLLESGVDVNRTNSYDQTALDIVKKFTSCGAAKDVKQMLKEAINAVQARAITNYHNPADPHGLSFEEGELISVLQQNEDGRWKGVIFGEEHSSRTGYFPANVVVLLDRPVGGMQRSTKPAQVKKVAPPTVPDVANRKSGGSYSSGYSSSNTVDRNSYGSMAGTDDSFPPTPSPPVPTNKDNCNLGPVYPSNNNNSTTIGDGSPAHTYPPYALTGQQYPYSHLTIGRSSTSSQPGSPLIQDPSFTQSHLYERYAPVYQQQASLEDQGIDMQSPGRDSPGSSGSSGSGCGSSSTGCRNSTTSLDSGRASSSAYDGKTGLNYVPSTQHRLSGQSYESSGSLRHSYHSSSSSLGSMEESAHISQINVAEFLATGYPDHEVLNLWLVELHFEEYYHLFVQAGYDMPTISRMTPEDLTAIGITKPGHRKKLKAEIARLNISDGLPVYIPATLEEWLHLLHLEEYEDALRQQGYHTVEQVTDVAWEDLEEIGIKKLGHQKKVMLAIKRVKDIMSGVRRFSTDQRECSHLMSGEAMHMYNYSPQDVAITPSSRSMTSPSSALDSIAQPEMRTFQQSPVMQRSAEMYRYEGVPSGSPLHHHHHTMYHHHPHHPFPHPAVSVHHTYRPNYASVIGTGSPSHLLYRPDMVAVHVRHPSGARSLENLESERDTMKPHYGINSSSAAEPRLYDGMMTWRRGSFDDGDLTPTNETMVAYEVEGGGTLPRPKVSVKPRPVAKIIAKTRRASTDSASDLIYIEHEAECKPMSSGGDLCTNTTTTIADVVTTHGSPRHQLVGSSNTLGRTKKTPPAPPKRTNSIKNDRNVDKNMDSKSEQAFANCVKSLTSKFTIPSHDDDLPPPPKEDVCGNRVISCLVDEFPPPPSPMKASLDDLTIVTPTPDAGEQDNIRLNSSPQQIDSDTELPHHPKRNDSNSSFDSSSSTDSNSLPFANENVGTIKQKAAQPHTSITVVELAWSPRSSPVPGKKVAPSGATPPPIPPRQNVKMEQAPQIQAKNGNPNEDPLAVKRPQDTGDVLNDIGNMLADLTDELDAMLVTELQGQ